MKTLFFTLITTLIFNTNNVFADEIWIGNKNKIPAEFNYLLESLQKVEFTPAEKNSLSSTLKELDAEFTLMTKEEIYLIVKGEIYKTILTYHKGTSEAPLEEGHMESLQKTLKEKGPKLNAFALWLMIALKSDVEVLLNHPNLGQLKLINKNKDLLRLKKKMNLIAPWVQKFLSMEIDEFHNELRPIMWDIFRRIENDARLFVLLGRFEKSKNNSGSLGFFSLQETSKADFFPELDSWLRRQTVSKDENKSNDWLPKDIRKDPNYIAPAVLPKPIDDWIDSSEWTGIEKNLLKDTQTGSSTKKVLPRPVDDWILN